MKKYIVLIILVIVLSHKTFSQETKDTLTIKKNELILDLIPIIKLLSNSDNSADLKGTLQYKRRLKNKLFIRIDITLFQKREPQKYSNIRSSYSDSLNYVVDYDRREYKPELSFTTGIEYRWGKKRIKQFTGLDIGYVHSSKTYSTYQEYIPNYINYNPNNNNPDIPLGNNNSINNAITSSHATTYNGVILNPFYGLQYHFSNRFFFSMQFGTRLQLLKGKNTVIKNSPTYQYPSVSYYDFSIGNGGILNNFSLGFRF
jgi:hypothetical protein